ncbi:hypothetical protein BS47DRAFT_139615 [Hydnum rufescens UP504]|uniref:Uncharacterized protein n=1 Tax=Hydnum rufescens UP504 TaxID=1448309 RepID=A0A9P6AQ80_9AGAM|nr:hypothetical protein BS47DRAFT_139615 [Hydnum rufescens UP504]
MVKPSNKKHQPSKPSSNMQNAHSNTAGPMTSPVRPTSSASLLAPPSEDAGVCVVCEDECTCGAAKTTVSSTKKLFPLSPPMPIPRGILTLRRSEAAHLNHTPLRVKPPRKAPALPNSIRLPKIPIRNQHSPSHPELPRREQVSITSHLADHREKLLILVYWPLPRSRPTWTRMTNSPIILRIFPPFYLLLFSVRTSLLMTQIHSLVKMSTVLSKPRKRS